LLVASAAILSVLHFGSALPQPAIGTVIPEKVAPEKSTVTSAPVESAIHMLPGSLQAGINHPLSRLFLQLLVVIGLAQAAGRFCRRIGQPAVVGEIITGILLGPSLLGLLAPEASEFLFPADSLGALRLLSQLGVCLFMFVVGTELDVGRVRRNTHVAIAVSHVGIAFPFVLGALLAYFLFNDLAGAGTSFTSFALFMGISMSITAFPVLARILQERDISRTFLGSTAMTCAAVDDVTAWTILAFVVSIASATSLVTFSLTTLLVLVFIAIMILGVRPALPRLLGNARMTREEVSHGTLGFILCIVIAASLTTEVLGIHALFGSFLAGAMMPGVGGFRPRVRARIQPFSSVLLLPLFFAFTGLRTEIGLLGDLEGWSICLLITAVASLGKLGGSAAAARFAGMPWVESLKLGALMNTRGLMELIALNIGYDMGILSARIFTKLVIMAGLTTMMTGPLLTRFGRQKFATAEDLQAPSSP
jgi:Kef-type K+ transport system membrane component KefB